MKKQRIYLDTSIFGGLHDEEFKDYTEPLFERVKKSEFEIIYSNVTEQELENAPDRIRATVELLPKDSTVYVKSDIESANLAKKYIDEGVVGPTSYADCLHIAMATIHNANILISWNFKHIVNVVRIVGYNSVNIAEGYKPIDIRSPRELMTYED
ncbi:type II toxin-antitoxin system VapC family toxin [Subsaximicrobium wynnwilliamsii]|uniref:Type II toxin-antitoxin system VapC family toxin n=1 Tax=Subsaximicrobium wynnwilliamsii TaxID=291179 RepID=A0A5C6ZDP4_9FLAO|nr:PIN domain-containing protein [Subsaximicrobium wynnwilliamsii]TXD82217.1 type II toxin-antitoxin system VapC family toxin [Subsaximicrobium wynnwilliamsii]TXD87857.1 type II toxin-antitoxin system VapC family toxin [Subsaximicrobium wynnwilliamsii]TXE01807.1 type II toxin-antitoxin system VapC family toxin [Subsaximicrobium wynnwilliamsii]